MMKSAVGDSLMTPFPRLAYLMEQILTWSNKHLKPQDCASNQVQATNRVVWCQNAVDPESRMKSAIGVSLMTPLSSKPTLSHGAELFVCCTDPRSRVPAMTPPWNRCLSVCLFALTQDPRSRVPLMTPLPIPSLPFSWHRYLPDQTTWSCIISSTFFALSGALCITMRHNPSIGTFHPAQTPVSQYLL